MKRSQLAEIVSEAYFNQFSERATAVMNDAIIVYDTVREIFFWQSSISPIDDTDVIVDTLVEGQFGDWDIKVGYTETNARTDLKRHINKENDDYWGMVQSVIREFANV